MREPKSMAICRQRGRYTLTYSEGTWIQYIQQARISIHPHIQWGNKLKQTLCSENYDIPSHTVREPIRRQSSLSQTWYTLTYSEGTKPAPENCRSYVIYPHIQWGNAASRTAIALICEIPSHTVREQSPVTVYYHPVRYTLTYSEGTRLCRLFNQQRMIYPHIQWGNWS